MSLSEKIKVLEGYESPDFEIITSKSLITKKKHSKLLDQDITVQINNKSPKEFELSELIYVDNIEFHAADDEGEPVLDLAVEFYDGTVRHFKEFKKLNKESSSKIYVHINDFVKKFNLKSLKWKGFKSCKLKKVVIEGYTAEKLREVASEFNDFIQDYEDLKNEIKKNNEALTENQKKLSEEKTNFENIKPGIQQEIESLKKEQSSLESAVESITKTKESLETNEAKLKASVEQLHSKETAIETNINKLSGERDNLNKDILDKEDKLSNLKQNESLFTESLQGLGEEGKKHIALYSRILVVLVLTVFVLGLFLTLQLNELIQLYLESKKLNLPVDAWDFFLMRAPYSPILLSIIAGIFAMIAKLISSILEIQTQRRSIISLSILAGEINHSSADGLDLSDDEKYRLKEELKFDLLSTSWMKNIFEDLKNKRNRLKGKLTCQKNSSSESNEPPGEKP